MKQSAQIGLVLMSALGVGGAAYLMMPGRDCTPATDPNALHAPATPGENQACAPRGSSGSSGTSSGGHGGSGGSHWFYGGSSSSGSSSTATSVSSSSSSSGTASRGGFGSIGHAFASFGG
jgi:hypothetical protein